MSKQCLSQLSGKRVWPDRILKNFVIKRTWIYRREGGRTRDLPGISNVIFRSGRLLAVEIEIQKRRDRGFRPMDRNCQDYMYINTCLAIANFLWLTFRLRTDQTEHCWDKMRLTTEGRGRAAYSCVKDGQGFDDDETLSCGNEFRKQARF